MDIQKQIDYWMKSAEEDFAAAQSLSEKGHFRHSLFFAHLAVEKMLKGHVVKQTGDMPPRIHDLVRLAETAQLQPTQEQLNFLSRFGLYQLEGRYPDAMQAILDAETTKEKLQYLSGVGLELGAGVGFTLVLIIMSGIRERLDLADTPKCFKGMPIAFLVAVILSIAFLAFGGMV